MIYLNILLHSYRKDWSHIQASDSPHTQLLLKNQKHLLFLVYEEVKEVLMLPKQ
jgi:hypothetical protein